MKQLFKGLLSACVTLLLCCCFFCCTAHADGNYDLQAKHDDLNSKGNPYGVDITYSITDEDKKEVLAQITKTYENEPVEIPDTVTFTDQDTGDSETYTVVALRCSSDCQLENFNTQLSLPSTLRTLDGNLFDWNNKTNTRYMTTITILGIIR